MGRILLFVLAVSLGLTACTKEDDNTAEQLEIDKKIIEDYLAENDLTAECTTSGLYYIIDNQGTGLRPTINSTVTVMYTGTLINGSVFDASTKPIAFPLTNVIQGWQEGIPLFNAGGTGKLFIPSGLGYGPVGHSTIPGNTVLIFDIYLISAR